MRALLGGLILSLAISSTAVAECQLRPADWKAQVISHLALQALDVHSTQQAMAAGAVEKNPMMRGVVRWPVGAQYAFKLGAGLGFTWMMGKIACRQPQFATWTVRSINATMGIVVTRNYRF